MAADEPEPTYDPVPEPGEELPALLHPYTYTNDTETLQRVLARLNEMPAA